MTRKPADRPRLNDRDFEIFDHLRRYRLTTREILHRLLLSDCELNAVTKVTSRLVRHEYLASFKLYTPRKYFMIGPKAARLIGISLSRIRELGPQALVQEYGTLEFCCGGEELRERLLVREIHQRNPDFLARHLDSSRYYLDHDSETVRLGFIRVDFGGELPHVIRKCREDVDRRYRHPAFRELIDGQRFVIAIVTAREERKKDIHTALRRYEWPIHFRIEVVPNLVHLLTRFQK